MIRSMRLCIAAILMVMLALPAVPAMARHGQAHDCCAGASAHHATVDAGDCSIGSAKPDPAPVCADSASYHGTSQPPGSCLHCVAVAVSGAMALHAADIFAFEPSAFMAPFHASSFVPAAPVDRLERPPQLSSF